MAHQNIKPNRDRVLVEGNVLLADPDVLRRIVQKSGLPFVTSGTLTEIQAIAKRSVPGKGAAIALLRELQSTPAINLDEVPPGGVLIGSDTLQRLSFKGTPVYILERSAAA